MSVPAGPAGPPKLLTTEEAATLLGLTGQCLRKWRTNGKGPLYVLLGCGTAARVVYRLTDIEGWLAAHTFPHKIGRAHV